MHVVPVSQNSSAMFTAHYCPIHRPPNSLPTFRFLDLPVEIRIQIAELLVLSSEPITIHAPRFNRHPTPPFVQKPPCATRPIRRNTFSALKGKRAEDVHTHTQTRTRLALLLTCRMLYSENWKAYYARNVLQFNIRTLVTFVEAIPRRCADQIRHVSVAPVPFYRQQILMWSQLRALKSLENLELLLPGHIKLDWPSCLKGVVSCGRLKSVRLVRKYAGVEVEDDGDRVDSERLKQFFKARECGDELGVDIAEPWWTSVFH